MGRDGIKDDKVADRALAQRIAAGDLGAITHFYTSYFARLYRHTYHELGGLGTDTEDAKDVLQLALLGALKGIRGYRGESTLYNWVCGIINNKVGDFRRRTFRRARIEERVQQAVGEPDDWDSILLAHERDERVCAVLYSLPGHYRQALVLKYVDCLPVGEIAREMGCTYKGAESTLTRARVAFRRAWAA